MSVKQFVIVALVLLVLGIIVFPLINRKQFINLPYDQQIRVLMKEANSLAYFKNISKGSSGTLYFVKNKRKILFLDWTLSNGEMHCTKQNPLLKWDYPENNPLLTDDERMLVEAEIESYNKKNPVKFIYNEVSNK